MSLYNMLFGFNTVAPALLGVLGMKHEDIPRFRDAYLADGQIVIYTRTGGGNRDYYENEESCRANYPEYFTGEDDPKGPWNDDLRAHACYVSDEDDDFDSTYAYFRFSYPAEYAEDLQALAEQRKDYTPSEKWDLLFKSMEKKG